MIDLFQACVLMTVNVTQCVFDIHANLRHTVVLSIMLPFNTCFITCPGIVFINSQAFTSIIPDFTGHFHHSSKFCTAFIISLNLNL